MTAVAIDGPAGAGKTTVARELAEELGWDYVDTGAMYRAVAARALERRVDLSDAAAVAVVATDVSASFTARPVASDGDQLDLRTPEVSEAASIVATHPEVRAVLVGAQRAAARLGHVVMEGRDIGSVVLPDAELKVYLTASLEERAVRRARELGTDPAGAAELRGAIEARDQADAARPVSPLVTAPDAVVIDTTGRTIEETVAEIVGLLRARVGAPEQGP